MMVALRVFLALGAMMSSVQSFAAIKVSDVEVFSGYPWKEVVVGYTITGTDNLADYIRLTATDKSANKSYTAKTLSGAKLTEGRHALRWNAAAEGVKLSSPNVVFTVSVITPGVQLWENGPCWAECNLGATKPEDYGYSFWWGDTVGYKRVGSSWNAVDGSKKGFSFVSENCPTYGKDNAALKSLGYIDSTGNLVAKYDAATVYLGVPWRIPTLEEWEALKSNCMTTWMTSNGVPGRLVTGKGAYASKRIFLPSDADSIPDSNLWSSTPDSDNSDWAWGNYFFSGNFYQGCYARYRGCPVRPVRGFAQ